MQQNRIDDNNRDRTKLGHIIKQNASNIKNKTQHQIIINESASYRVPPLLDLSLQNTFTHHMASLTIPSLSSRQSSYNTNNSMRKTYTPNSMFVQENTQNSNKTEMGRNSLSVTRADSKQQEWEKFKIIQQNIHKKQQNNFYTNQLEELQQKQGVFNRLPKITQLTLQIYQQIIIQEYLNRKNNVYKKNTEQQKNSKQTLAILLSNSNKLQQFLQLQRQQLYEHKLKYLKNAYSKDKSNNDRQLSKQYKRQSQVSQMLSCLLVKVRQGSLNCGQRFPYITRGRNGQIQINFSDKNGKFRPIIRDTIANEDENQISKMKLELIKQLNIKLYEQDSLIQKIKHQYDGVINNLAATVYNLCTQQRGNSNLKKSFFYDSPSEAERHGNKFIKVNQQIQENSVNDSKEDKADKQLRDLIINSRRIDTQSVFNRLSLQSRRKSKMNNLSISFQDQL